MDPTIREGAIVLAVKKTPRLNDIVIANAGGREVLKRVTILDSKHVTLCGDNQGSASYVGQSIKCIKGVVVASL